MNAVYKLQIFNFKEGKSLQRSEQLYTSMPVQQYYSFNYTNLETQKPKKESQYTNLIELTTSPEVTYRIFPLDKNKVLVRFTNLADRFDSKVKDVEYIDVQRFAEELYASANERGINGTRIKITEQGISHGH